MTSHKEQDFIRNPLKDVNDYVDVDHIVGVSDRAAEILKKRGYGKAYQLIGMWLMLGMDKEIFVHWLKDLYEEENYKLLDGPLERTARCVDEWCKKNMFSDGW